MGVREGKRDKERVGKGMGVRVRKTNGERVRKRDALGRE